MRAGAVVFLALVTANVAEPVVTQATLAASDGVRGDQFGYSVAISGDTAVVGANARGSGAVYVFVRSGTGWTQQAKLTVPGLSNGDALGVSVAISGDTIVSGAAFNTNILGAAYVFVRNGTTWTQQAKLTASDGAAGDAFGISVAVNGDTIVVGASGRNSGRGAAYVFFRSGTAWSEQAELSASDGSPGDQFGCAVSVDSQTAVVGANEKGSGQGAAYVFTRSGASWSQQAELTSADGVAGDQFANSVSVSGNTVVAGANNKASNLGAAYVFLRSGATWAQQAELMAFDGAAGDFFGNSVALSGDTAVVGSFVQGSERGAAYVFTRSGNSWTQQDKLTASDGGSGDALGWSVAVSGDTAVAGAPLRASKQGEAYVFPMPSTVSISSVVNGASFQPPLAPGSLATVFGNNFASANAQATDLPLPATLGRVSVTVNGMLAPLLFVGPQQINFQVPYETTVGTATIAVSVNGISSVALMPTITATAPGIFVFDGNRAVAQDQDYTLNDDAHPAAPGTFVMIYATGLGQLDNPIPTGSPAPSSPLSRALVVPTVTIGGMNADVAFAGMTPGLVGLAQINAKVPDLSPGTYAVMIVQGDQTSNAPVLAVGPAN